MRFPRGETWRLSPAWRFPRGNLGLRLSLPPAPADGGDGLELIAVSVVSALDTLGGTPHRSNHGRRSPDKRTVRHDDQRVQLILNPALSRAPHANERRQSVISTGWAQRGTGPARGYQQDESMGLVLVLEETIRGAHKPMTSLQLPGPLNTPTMQHAEFRTTAADENPRTLSSATLSSAITSPHEIVTSGAHGIVHLFERCSI